MTERGTIRRFTQVHPCAHETIEVLNIEFDETCADGALARAYLITDTDEGTKRALIEVSVLSEELAQQCIAGDVDVSWARSVLSEVFGPPEPWRMVSLGDAEFLVGPDQWSAFRSDVRLIDERADLKRKYFSRSRQSSLSTRE